MVYRALAGIAIAMVISCSAQTQFASKPKIVAPLMPLLEALHRENASAFLAFSGRCDLDTPLDFPHFATPSPTANSALDIARQIFDEPDVRVSQDPDGTLRIIKLGVSMELLNVRMGRISFESNGSPLQYAAFSPEAAVRHVILKAPEVISFMKGHHIETKSTEAAPSSNFPYPTRLTHISGSMNDLTVSQALDRISRTFPGIWVYESCPQADRNGELINFLFLDRQHPGLFEEWEHR